MTQVLETDKRPLNGRECSVRLGYNPTWAYMRTARSKPLPAHLERVKWARYAFSEECIREFEAAPPVSRNEVYNRPELLDPWEGEVGIFRNLPDSEDVDRALDCARILERVKRALPALGEREHLALAYRFGLFGASEETLEEVGARFGVTRQRVSQIEAAALHKIREALQGWCDKEPPVKPPKHSVEWWRRQEKRGARAVRARERLRERLRAWAVRARERLEEEKRGARERREEEKRGARAVRAGERRREAKGRGARRAGRVGKTERKRLKEEGVRRVMVERVRKNQEEEPLWEQLGFSPGHRKVWALSGFGPLEAHAWRQAGHSIRSAKVEIAAGRPLPSDPRFPHPT